MLPNRVYCFLNCFDLFFHSGSSKLFHRKKSILIIRFVLILLAFWFTLNQVFFIYYFYVLNGLIETLNETVESVVSLICLYLIILDNTIQQRAHTYFWTLVHQINENFYCQSNFTFRSHAVQFVGFILIIAMQMAIFIYCQSSYVYCVYVFLIKICQIRVLYYLFCLKVVQFQLKNIQREFEDVSTAENSTPLHLFEPQRFKWSRSYFNCIYRMITALNDTFGWSHVATMPYCFFCLFTELNYFYMKIYEFSFVENLGALLYVFSSSV